VKRRNFLISGTAALGLGALYWPQRWKYIVIHHSAGDYGNIDFLRKVHQQRQANDPINAIPYHFIIGNGHGLGDGEIASGIRRKYHLWGAHVSARNPDHNLRGLGICLIGNFEKDIVSEKQYVSAVSLTRRLMAEYAVRPENVNGHGLIEGESTLCPGRNFPMQQFLQDIV
jgi:N-acetylmuramoyl-L-alanine amidase